MKKVFYEILMGILASIAVTFSVIDISSGLNKWEIIVDNAILAIFVADYFIRLFVSSDKKKYFKDNIFDLIAIIPLNSAFRIFRIAKLTKVLRIVKITKIAKFSKVLAYSIRLFKKARRFFDTNGFKYMVFITMIFIAIGGFFIHLVEEISFQDGIWWAFVTATTVGYGDISPNTVLGRLIATVLMLTGIGLIGSLTSTITTYFFNIKIDRTVKHEMLENIKSKIDDVDNLTDEDIDSICRVLKGLNK